MKFYINIIVLLLVLIPFKSYGDNYIKVQKDEPAPFTGFLLHQDDLAKIVVKFEGMQKKCEIEKEKIKKEKDALLQVKKEYYEGVIKSNEKIFKEIITLKEDTIKKLFKINKQQESMCKFKKYFYGISGVIIGVVITSIGLYVYGEFLND